MIIIKTNIKIMITMMIIAILAKTITIVDDKRK